MDIIIGKTQNVVKVDIESMASVSKDFIFAYGLRQILNDCHASVQRKDFETQEAFMEAVDARVNAKLNALYSGDISTRTASGKPALSPLEAMMEKIAKEIVIPALRAKVKSLGGKFGDITDAQKNKILQEYIEKNHGTLGVEAAKRLKAQKAQADSVELDLSELGL